MKKNKAIEFEDYNGDDGKPRGVCCWIGSTRIKFRTTGEDIVSPLGRFPDSNEDFRAYWGLNKDVRVQLDKELKQHLTYKVRVITFTTNIS